MPTNRSKALDEQILERLAEGELVTKMCRDDAMPSIRQLHRWRRTDVEFDSSCWSSEAQGLMVQRSEFIETMHEAIKEGGPDAAFNQAEVRPVGISQCIGQSHSSSSRTERNQL